MANGKKRNVDLEIGFQSQFCPKLNKPVKEQILQTQNRFLGKFGKPENWFCSSQRPSFQNEMFLIDILEMFAKFFKTRQ